MISTHCMEEQPLFHLQDFVRSHLLLVVLAVIGVVLLGAGGIFLMPHDEEEISFDQPKTEMPIATVSPKLDSQVVVDIEGAVAKPGVYTLPAGSRMKDLVLQAGGVRKEADEEVVSQQLNLAQKLTDGSKVYIPFTGETGIPVTDQAVAGASTKVININTASLSELDTLPKIGDVTAQKIIANRPYASVDELLSKKVVGSAVFSEIKELVSTQ